MPTTHLVITVAQEEGSLGREIAQQLARFLQLTYVDEAVLQLATEKFSHSEVENYIRDLAGKGRVVFVGCGANFVLQDFEGVVNVLIRAPLTPRIETTMQSKRLDRASAERRLYHLDERYASYIRHYYGPEWTNPDFYDLTINTKTMPVDRVVRSLGRFIQTLDQSCAAEGKDSRQLPGTIQTSPDLKQPYHKVVTDKKCPALPQTFQLPG